MLMFGKTIIYFKKLCRQKHRAVESLVQKHSKELVGLICLYQSQPRESPITFPARRERQEFFPGRTFLPGQKKRGVGILFPPPGPQQVLFLTFAWPKEEGWKKKKKKEKPMIGRTRRKRKEHFRVKAEATNLYNIYLLFILYAVYVSQAGSILRTYISKNSCRWLLSSLIHVIHSTSIKVPLDHIQTCKK